MANVKHALLLVTCTSLLTHTTSKVLRTVTPLPPDTAAILEKVRQDVQALKVPSSSQANETSTNPLKVTPMSQCSFLAGYVTGDMTKQCCKNVQVVMQRQLHNYGLASKCNSTWKCEEDGVTPQSAFEAESLSGLCGEPGCLPRVVKALKHNQLTARGATAASRICSRLADIGGASASPEEISSILSKVQRAGKGGGGGGNNHGSTTCKLGNGDEGEVECQDGEFMGIGEDKDCDKNKMMKKHDGTEQEQCAFCKAAGCEDKKACKCDTKDACFPGDAVVDVKGAGKTLLRQVREGDQILVDQQGNLAYEPVLSFLHSLPAGLHRFTSITHEDGVFRASSNHIVIVSTDAQGSSWKSKLVGDVQVGDYLFSNRNGTVMRMPSRVKAIDYGSTRSGMFAPLTYSGTIVVDGVVASNYASRSSSQYLPHSLVHAFLLPVRLYHKLVLTFRSSLSSKRHAEVISEELHPYLQIMQHLSVLVPSQ